MKKLILVVFLILVLVAVAYLRFWRAEERVANAYEAGRAGVEAEIVDFEARLDSLRYLVTQQSSMMDDSFAVERNDYLCTIDSLIQILDSSVGGDPIAADTTGIEGSPARELAGTEDSASEEPAGADAALDSANGQPVAVDTALATAVMRHYRELESGLPTDLSRYERKVATYEISVQTAREFSLSLAEFKAIREMFSATD